MSASYEFGHKGPIQPFWQRIQRFFLLPLDRAVLLRIAALSGALAMSCLLIFAGFPGFLLLIAAVLAILVVGTRYGFKIIERSSKGYLAPSDYPLTDEDLVSAYLPYKYVAICMVYGVIAFVLLMLMGGGEVVAVLLQGLFFVVLLPASAIRLVITGSLRAALNPAENFKVMSRIGQPYIVLCVFLFFAELSRTYGMLLIGATGGVGAAAVGNGVAGLEAALGAGTLVVIFAMSAGFWYFTFMICALIGYTMYQYAEQLEIAVLDKGGRRLKSLSGRHADVKARRRDSLIGRLVSDGDVKEAIALLNDDLRERPQDLSLHARLHKLLLTEGSTLRIEDHTEKYLNLLVKSQNWHEALAMADEALARRADWSPRQVENIAPLARAALQKGRSQLAGTLIRGFDKKYPNHPDIPQVYLVGAQLMAETSHQPAESRRILQYLLKRYGSDPVAAEASRYLEVLNRMHPAT
jgi:hypothetical protein